MKRKRQRVGATYGFRIFYSAGKNCLGPTKNSSHKTPTPVLHKKHVQRNKTTFFLIDSLPNSKKLHIQNECEFGS